MAIRMGRWDCPSCGKKANLASELCCKRCGRSRGNDDKFYELKGEPAITDDAEIAVAKAGPDWECAHCNAANRATASFCTACGKEKGTSPSREVITYDLDEIPTTAEEAKQADGVIEVRPPNFDPQPGVYDRGSVSVSRHGLPLKSAGYLALVGLVILGIYWLFFQTHEVPVTVNAFDWSRTIHIEQYRTVREGDWSVPARGRLVSTEERIHHHDRVLDHYETKTREVYDHTETYNCGSRDLGNGYFEDVECSRSVYRDETYQDPVYRQDPVYQTWFNYDIDKWVRSRDVVASGTTRDDPAPSWPTFTLAYEAQTVIGAERVGSREDRYRVTFIDAEGKTYQREEDENDWRAYEFGQEYILILNNLDTITNDPLRPE